MEKLKKSWRYQILLKQESYIIHRSIRAPVLFMPFRLEKGPGYFSELKLVVI